jgi:hypothetical protein
MVQKTGLVSAGRPDFAIDEPEIECGVVGNEKLIGCQEAPFVGSMNGERVLQAQTTIVCCSA